MATSLAIDIGGTFIDTITIDMDSGGMELKKVPSAQNPTDEVLGLFETGTISVDDLHTFIHGTTLGINALLEREGANVGIITNEGFRDIFEMGRYDLPDDELYNYQWEKPTPLVPRRKRVGVPGRLNSDGEEIEPLDEAAVSAAAASLVNEFDVESIAICFLHSYQNPAHEERAADIVRAEYPEVTTSVSNRIVREHYEYERTSTTVLDSYIKPIFEEYIDALEQRLIDQHFDGTLLITRSGGGSLPVESAKDTPVHTILSGPAGGVIGASHVGSVIGREDLIAIDMGGTSLETCVIQDGTPSVGYESEFEHLPVLIPVFDIRTIGAGGGSIAWTDGDLLKVGPKSAGADPGPICYGRGGQEPTVTDAVVHLGYIRPGDFLGGDMAIDVDSATDGIREKVAEPLDMTTFEASKGIIDVLVNKQVGAIREITVERGLDPREFSLLVFGGAGPMMASLIARELDVAEIIVPQAPSVFSAWGMLMADVTHDFSRTYLSRLDTVPTSTLKSDLRQLRQSGQRILSNEGFSPENQYLEQSVEMRYVGQEHTVEFATPNIESMESLQAGFESRHEEIYGHTLDDAVELVYLRVRGIGETEKPPIREQGIERSGTETRSTERSLYCFAADEQVPFDVYDRATLSHEDSIDGPAIVQEATSTTLLFSDQVGEIDRYGHIVITNQEAA